MKTSVFLLLTLLSLPLLGQFPDSSRLAIVDIYTSQPIIDRAKITADMCIRYAGPNKWTFSEGDCNNYEGKIGIEIRGSSSQFFDKKGYGFETREEDGSNRNVELVGMPKENDWVLNGPYSDKSLIRNALTYELGRSMGRWAPRTRFVELNINEVYQGVYVLMEKIKRDKNRVNIAKLDDTDTDPQDITGGYLLKIDKTTGGIATYSWQGEFGDIIQVEYPKEDAYLPAQAAYIANYMTAFEKTLRTMQFTNEDSLGYRHYIEPSSFIDFLIVNEVAKNVDGYRLSTWLYKDREGRGEDRLQMGPLWDFNLAFGNANYCTGGGPEGWVLNFNQICPRDGWVINYWWDRLLSDPQFQEELVERWFALREDEFSTQRVLARVDAMVAEIGPAAQRNFDRWEVLGEYVWPNSYIGNTYQQEINFLKDWLRDRLVWIDQNIENISFQVQGSFSYGASVGVYPNPFSDELTLSLQFNNEAPLLVEVRNIAGQRVFYSEIEISRATFSQWRWDGLDNQGNALPTGLYFLSLQQNDKIVASRKLIKN